MINKILEFDNIFITGIFGSGKTYLARFAKPPTHTYISFDDNYSYETQDLTRIYRLMNGQFIMDALPLTATGIDDRLKVYYAKHNCCTVLLKCDIDIWLERLKSKRWYDGSKIQEYKKNYDEFYNNDVKNNIESFDNVFMYDSGKENIMNVEGGCYWV